MKKAYMQHRSFLFVPAFNMRAMEKTLKLDADVVIFDLEDSVSVDDKAKAIENLKVFFKAHKTLPYQATVRINPLVGDKNQELKLVASLPIEALLVPKVEDGDVLDSIYTISKSVAKKTIPLWAMIETPKGILAVNEIAFHPNVSCLVVGPNDIALATGVGSEAAIKGSQLRPYLTPWLMQIILAAKAANCSVLDGVYNDYKNITGFEEECQQAQAMGFDGKTLIHPNQIVPTNHIFMPTKTQIYWAQTIVDAFALPDNSGKGVIAVDGKMVEVLHLEQAQRILRRAGIHNSAISRDK